MKTKMSVRQPFKDLLAQAVKTIGPDLLGIVIVDENCLVIESHVKPGFNDKVLGGLSGAVHPVIQRVRRELGLAGKFGVGTFDTDFARLIFCEAGLNAMVILVGDLYASLDALFPYCYLLAEKVRRILDGRLVTPFIPILTAGEGKTQGSRDLQQIYLESDRFVSKVILGGEGGVGKTSLVHQFVEGQCPRDYKETIGVSILAKEVNFREWGVSVLFSISDLGGQIHFTRVRQTYMKGAHAGFLVYDVTRPETFERIKNWYAECKRAEPEMFLMLIANKIDLNDQRKVTPEEGHRLAAELDLTYFETSAMDGDLVGETFKALALLIIQKYRTSKKV